jgi:SSS family solute:Na+ symporter
MITDVVIQLSVFLGLTALVGFITWLHCRQAARSTDTTKEYFLANSGLNWMFIAGSITLTNINTDTLVGWNGNQMLLIMWWELAAVLGLILLAEIFVPIYYKYNCTTVTELLERRYNNKHIRGTVATIFLLGNVFLFLPAMLYTSSLIIKSMFGLPPTIAGIDTIMVLATFTAVVGAAYAIIGGLRAVAISDTYSGVIVLALAMLVVFLALNAVRWSFAGIPVERLTMIGDSHSVLPWPTLLTGMIFTQLYYWSTNQTITQRALAAPSIRGAKKGVYASAVIRLFIIPPMIAIPGVCAYKLYGNIGDQAYGRLVSDVLPHWLMGAFAAAMFAAVMTSYNATLNSSAALYVCDLHQKYVKHQGNIARLSMWVSFGFALLSILLVPLYEGAPSIIQRIQSWLGLFSMPVLSAFITGLLFRNVDARAVIATILFGSGLYGFFTFVWTPLHFLHLMFITVWACVGFALLLNRVVFGRRAELELAKIGQVLKSALAF